MNRMFTIDDFCLRQFNDPNYTGTKINYDLEKFEATINEMYENQETKLVEGYAPFCKHLFVKNFTDCTVNAVEISKENETFLKCEYEARTEKELPVLVRYFPKNLVKPSKAKFLDIILYSREQINEEHAAMGIVPVIQSNSPWGIISVKAQDVDYELPMQPITIMRNSLGKTEGGSGVPLDRQKYMESVDYWKSIAILK